MADKKDSKNNGNEKSKHEPAEKKIEKFEKFSETIQYLGILGAIIMGLRQPPKPGEAVVGDKQVPNWLLSAFPSLTKEDEVEYNVILSSLANGIKIALKEFEARLKIEKIYDEVKFRIMLVKIRREFMEKMKNPMPENKSTTLTFGPLVINDPVTDFATLLANEKVAGKTPARIFKNQILIADNLKLLEKRSFLKKLSENKVSAILWMLFIIAAMIAILAKNLS